MNQTTTHSVTDIDGLASDARVWIFQSSKPLVDDIRSEISSQLIAFLKEWAAHGQKLFAGFEIRFDRFIIIGVDEAMAKATGCSIDKLMQIIQAIDQQHGLALLDRMKVAYRKGEEICECDANAFSKMLGDGSVNADTIVFNNVVQSLNEFQQSWECKVKDSWHVNLIP